MHDLQASKGHMTSTCQTSKHDCLRQADALSRNVRPSPNASLQVCSHYIPPMPQAAKAIQLITRSLPDCRSMKQAQGRRPSRALLTPRMEPVGQSCWPKPCLWLQPDKKYCMPWAKLCAACTAWRYLPRHHFPGPDSTPPS